LFACATVALLGGCRAQFDGPYPCATGYASCVDPQSNQCETNVSTDGLHCGVCGKACPLGATCTAGTCGAPATVLGHLNMGSQTTLAANSSAVFWESSSPSSGIQRVAAGGGPATPVATDAFICGSSASFAVDDHDLYYWSNGAGQPGPGHGELVKRSLADGSVTVLMTSTANTMGCPLLAVDATNVYVASGTQNGPQSTVSVTEVPIAGSAATMLGTVQANGGGLNGMALSAHDVVFAGFNNSGPPSLRLVPIDGGPVTTLSVGMAFFNLVVADGAYAYVVGSGCPCNGGNNNGNYTGLPTGNVTRIALDTGETTDLADFLGQVGGAAVDSSYVYWATDTTLWKVPISGGDAVPIAGNLSSGAMPYRCNGCGGGPGTTSPVAVGGSHVYVAASGSILEVPR
jgi:hypothetical protein